MGTYTYTSRPRALPCQRRRYRDSLKQPAEEPIHYGNIMYDRRVIRGNTYAVQTGPLFSSQLFNNLPKNSMLRLPVPDKQEFANSPSKNRKILEV